MSTSKDSQRIQYLLDKWKKTAMVYADPTTQQISHSRNLGQLLVRPYSQYEFNISLH